MKTAAWITTLLLAALPLLCSAQTATMQPGKYVTEGGWGHLTIEPAKGGAQRFAIEALGGNMHSCTLDGDIRNGKSLLDVGEPGKPCVVSFKLVGSNVQVSNSTAEQCRQFCGMRAAFDGLYLTPAAGCDSPARRATRNKFKALYDKKAFDEARAVLQPVLANCASTMDRIALSSLRNDLAITQYHLGDFAACISTLAPLAEDASKTDAEVLNSYPPSDAESFLPSVRAARVNLKLCRQGR